VTEYDRRKEHVEPFEIKIPTSDSAIYALQAIFELPVLGRLQMFHDQLRVSSSFGGTLDETLLASMIIFWMNKGNPQPSEK
jgi:hypothetical protein